MLSTLCFVKRVYNGIVMKHNDTMMGGCGMENKIIKSVCVHVKFGLKLCFVLLYNNAVSCDTIL